MLKKRFKRDVFLFFLVLSAGILGAEATHSEADKDIFVHLTIPQKYQQVTAGEPFLLQTEILRLPEKQEQPVKDLIIHYVVRNKEGASILALSETKSAYNRLDVTKELIIPQDAAAGIYIVEVTAENEQIRGSDAGVIKVILPRREDSFSPWLQQRLLFLFLVAAATLLPAFFFLYFSRKLAHVEKMVSRQRIRESEKHRNT